MMDLTPLEVRKKKDDFRRQIRGYEPGQVDDFLDLVADRLEQLVRENTALTESAGRLEQQVGEYREREKALTEALVSAQQMREEMRIQATRDADQARTQAASDAERSRSEAREVLAKAKEQAARQLAEAKQQAERELADAHEHAVRELAEAKAQAEAEAARILGDARELRQREESLLQDLRTRRAGLLETYGSLLEREIADLQGLRRAAEHVEAGATSVAGGAGSGLRVTPAEAEAPAMSIAVAPSEGIEAGAPEAAPAAPRSEMVDTSAVELELEAAEIEVEAADETVPELEVETAGEAVVELELDTADEAVAEVEVEAAAGESPERSATPGAERETWLSAVGETYALEDTPIESDPAETVAMADAGAEPAAGFTGVAGHAVPSAGGDEADSDDDFLADLLLEDADEDAIAAIILAEDAVAGGGARPVGGAAVPAESLEGVPGPPVADPSSDEEWLESLLEEVGVAPMMAGATPPPARPSSGAPAAADVVEELLLSDEDLPASIGQESEPAAAASVSAAPPVGDTKPDAVEVDADESRVTAAAGPEPSPDSGSDEMEALLARADAEMRAAEAAAGLGDLAHAEALGDAGDDSDDDIGIDAMFRDEDDDLRDFDFDAALVNATGMPAAPEGTDPLTFTNIPADDRARAPARPFGVGLVSDDLLEDRGFDRNEFGMIQTPRIPPAPNGLSHATEEEATDSVSVERQRPADDDDDMFATLFDGR
jgi:cell division initiation protein